MGCILHLGWPSGDGVGVQLLRMWAVVGTFGVASGGEVKLSGIWAVVCIWGWPSGGRAGPAFGDMACRWRQEEQEGEEGGAEAAEIQQTRPVGW